MFMKIPTRKKSIETTIAVIMIFVGITVFILYLFMSNNSDGYPKVDSFKVELLTKTHNLAKEAELKSNNGSHLEAAFLYLDIPRSVSGYLRFIASINIVHV